ncbi:phosphatidylglycerophosphatase A family protein [Pelistega ratti]|uniref:phosphatidylglycerophosphatase A family protein n=1 Tax=Pelistega ratti TaxID=2652177 RepID=UPI00135C97B3|nr:phosphatidylglycerophosphatase A [Pelistega ratti]
MDHTTLQERTIPNAEWMRKSVFRLFAFGFGTGLIKKAPGTWGSLLGWFSWLIIAHIIGNDIVQAVIILLGFAFGIYVCQRTSNELGVTDHGGIVWDEIVAMWLVFFVMLSPNMSFLWQLVAFVIFRFFDIIKPWPIHYFDEHFKNGFGVMWDDIIVAVYTLFVMAIAVRFLGV